mgnify:CR=1 FL=1
MTTQQITKDNRQLWLAAIKPPMYSVAVIPILVGTAIAFSQTHLFSPKILFTFLGSAILIIAWLNLSNDVFDADTGIDVNKAHSVVNLTGNKTLVFWVSNFCLSCGIFGIIAICWWQKDWTILGIVSLCCVLGYTYQGPPFRFGYLGLGEIICFFTFGPGAVAAAYYSQAQSLNLSVWAISSTVGISTSIILFCSHFHQVEDDLAAGKRSPIVRLGTARGTVVLAWMTGSFFAATVILVIFNYMSWLTLIVFASLPVAYQLVDRVKKHHDQPNLVKNSKFIAVNFHFWSGLLLCAGLVLAVFV